MRVTGIEITTSAKTKLLETCDVHKKENFRSSTMELRGSLLHAEEQTVTQSQVENEKKGNKKCIAANVIAELQVEDIIESSLGAMLRNLNKSDPKPQTKLVEPKPPLMLSTSTLINSNSFGEDEEWIVVEQDNRTTVQTQHTEEGKYCTSLN
jgi:hypothetical protein